MALRSKKNKWNGLWFGLNDQNKHKKKYCFPLFLPFFFLWILNQSEKLVFFDLYFNAVRISTTQCSTHAVI